MKTWQDIDSLDNRNEAFMVALANLIHAFAFPYFRAEVRGLDRIPHGRALYVGNHSGGFITADSFLFGSALIRERGVQEMPYGLGHELIVSLPGLNPFLTMLGAVRASAENGRRIFESGHKVLVYPGGDVEVMRPWRDRNRIVFEGRTGYIRLALRNDAPILPFVAAGAHGTFLVIDDCRGFARLIRADRLVRSHVWPLTLSFPWGLTFGPPPLFIPFPSKILIEVLAPVRFDRSGEEAAADGAYVRRCADRVEGLMQDALTRLAAEREGR